MMVRVEISSFRDFETEWRQVVVASQYIVDVTGMGGVMLGSSGEINRPESLIG